MGVIRPVILCGGGGSRLWPLSSPDRPKQFLALVGDETMLQMTAARVARGDLFDSPMIVTGRAHAAEAMRQLADAGIKQPTVVVEPNGRDTAAAIALAVLNADDDDILLVMPSDHVIANVSAFHSAVERGLDCARENWIVTLGVQPDRPETGYGYIEIGEPIATGVFAAKAFVEKPDRNLAETLAQSGQHVWNAGLFLFRAGVMANAIRTHAPAVWSAVEKSCQLSSGTPSAAAFGASPAVSIDRAVMEKERHIALVPVNMAWSDIGNWDALYTLGSKDSDGNILSAGAVSLGARGTLIRSSRHRIVAVGVHDLVIVEADDAILVMKRGLGQAVADIKR